jgi:hypothetical protein
MQTNEGDHRQDEKESQAEQTITPTPGEAPNEGVNKNQDDER